MPSILTYDHKQGEWHPGNIMSENINPPPGR